MPLYILQIPPSCLPDPEKTTATLDKKKGILLVQFPRNEASTPNLPDEENKSGGSEEEGDDDKKKARDSKPEFDVKFESNQGVEVGQGANQGTQFSRETASAADHQQEREDDDDDDEIVDQREEQEHSSFSEVSSKKQQQASQAIHNNVHPFDTAVHKLIVTEL